MINTVHHEQQHFYVRSLNLNPKCTISGKVPCTEHYRACLLCSVFRQYSRDTHFGEILNNIKSKEQAAGSTLTQLKR